MAGSKPGERRGGRQKGTPNKRTAQREAAMADAAEKIKAAIGDESFDGDAHTLLALVYRDHRQPIELRVEAAKAAVRYERPALATVDLSSRTETTVYQISGDPMTLEEWQDCHCRDDLGSH